jgi:hypothetical protein
LSIIRFTDIMIIGWRRLLDSGPLPDSVMCWRPNIGDPTMADAICDRLPHNTYKIDMRDDFMPTKRPVMKTDNKEIIERENKLS